MLGMGTLVSLYLMYCLFIYDVKAEIHTGHILYTLSFPMALAGITSIFYIIPTIAPLFVSSLKAIQLLGVAVFTAFVLSKIYFEEHLISVWCFFAALLSVAILWIIAKIEKTI
jgi:hypothetical protein